MLFCVTAWSAKPTATTALVTRADSRICFRKLRLASNGRSRRSAHKKQTRKSAPNNQPAATSLMKCAPSQTRDAEIRNTTAKESAQNHDLRTAPANMNQTQVATREWPEGSP